MSRNQQISEVPIPEKSNQEKCSIANQQTTQIDTNRITSEQKAGIRNVKKWFREQGWQPFLFQIEAWERYLAGESGLIQTATGMGKTYAAFLGALIEARLEARLKKPIEKNTVQPQAENIEFGKSNLKILWVTPLRALANDTLMNLDKAIQKLMPDWQIGIRTGDTSNSARSRQLKKMPDVLITTPESICLLMTQELAHQILGNLRLVVVDEWHALLASKRGVQTELLLAHLRSLNPQMRIWGLSATLADPKEAMSILLGTNHSGVLIQDYQKRKIDLKILLPEKLDRFPWAGHLGLKLLPELLKVLHSQQSSLVFTNTRAQSEIWYQAILQQRPDWAGLLAVHHGSLDRKLRTWIEDQLRLGKLKCVICTSSLDLGIDFSPVDQMVQIGSPKGIARFIQRIGRSRHQPGKQSNVYFLPANALEILEIAAVEKAISQGKIEAIIHPSKPIDVLIQFLVTIAIGSGFTKEDLFNEIRTARSYETLTPEEFEWAIDFVTRGGKILSAYDDFQRVKLENGLYRVTDKAIIRRQRMAIGTIMSESTMGVRYLSGKRLGSIEESFIAKLQEGDCFIFAGQAVEMVRTHEMTVWVKKSKRQATLIPRWLGGKLPLSAEIGTEIRCLLDRLANSDSQPDQQQGQNDNDWKSASTAVKKALTALQPLLQLQQKYSVIPNQNEWLIENWETREGLYLFIYPFEGALVHEGLATLLAYRLTQQVKISVQFAVNDHGFTLLLSPPLSFLPSPTEQDFRQWFQLEGVPADLEKMVNVTEATKRQFREIARISGLVSSGYPGTGKPDRQLQASSNMFYEVFRGYDPDNLLLRQAREEVLNRQFDWQKIQTVLEKLPSLQLRMVPLRNPSPFSFPLLVERIQGTMSSEKLADRIQRLLVRLENMN